MILNGCGGTAVGGHILFKVGELLLGRAAADQHQARVLVPCGGGVPAAAAGCLALGGAGRTAALRRIAAALLALAVLGRAGIAAVPFCPLLGARIIAVGALLGTGRLTAALTLAVLGRSSLLCGRLRSRSLFDRAQRGSLRGAHKVGGRIWAGRCCRGW